MQMKKRILLCVLLCLSMLLMMLAACETTDDSTPPPEGNENNGTVTETPSGPKAIYMIDFADGKTDFLSINSSFPTSDFATSLEVTQLSGASALKITTPGGGEARIGISIDGLLGSRVTDVAAVVIGVEAEYPDGTFRPVGGRISAMSGSTAAFAEESWTIYMENVNPRDVMLEVPVGSFGAGGPNLVEFSILNNGPAEKGETPAAVYITSISLLDSGLTTIPVDTSASFTAPEGYGESSLANWEIPITGPTVAEAKFFEFYTWGIDGSTGEPSGPDGKNVVGTDDYLPYEVLAASYGISFVMNTEPAESIVLINNSAFNGWGWNQNDNQSYSYADGVLSIMWRNTNDMDTAKITADNWAVKLRIGSWSEEFTTMVDSAYLIYDESAVN